MAPLPPLPQGARHATQFNSPTSSWVIRDRLLLGTDPASAPEGTCVVDAAVTEWMNATELYSFVMGLRNDVWDQAMTLYVHSSGDQGQASVLCASLLALMYNINAAEAIQRAQIPTMPGSTGELLMNNAQKEMTKQVLGLQRRKLRFEEMKEGWRRRREIFSTVFASAVLLTAPQLACAEVTYSGVGFLGGSSTIDVNNANIRVYTRLPGMYPNIAGKIVKATPYNNVGEIASKAGLSSSEVAVLKKYESRFITLEPKPEYVIDNINNGLYK